MGVGIVIRDEGGRFVAAKMKVVPYIVDPNAAGTIAAWSAVQFGREMGANRIVLEGDSMVVVSALRASESCDRLFGQLIDNIKSYFSHFSPVKVNHVRREANVAAHVMAKMAISNLLNHSWVGECPRFIQDVVAAECNFSD
ncbi:uncharacterized protein LOC133863384 [Alnus glutinosa]|uniref:uncharacterized protein LOC133863384 n=1 Tax=Alnus glutinosa TaxID=3517 RepID=UPI002D776143|nr:uncharacterized protein LOC133863384 [Alnus glutinosa]